MSFKGNVGISYGIRYFVPVTCITSQLLCFIGCLLTRFFLLCLLQAAFLSALAGTKVAEAAARAAVTALSDVDHEAGKNAGGDPNGQGITDYS